MLSYARYYVNKYIVVLYSYSRLHKKNWVLYAVNHNQSFDLLFEILLFNKNSIVL